MARRIAVLVRETTVTIMTARSADPRDAGAICAIYNEGITDRIATFETRLRTPDDIVAWFGGRHPVVVVEGDGEVIAFAAASTYRPRDCYAGIAEFSVYVARSARGRGAGRRAMESLIAAVEVAGFTKLVSRVFVENTASLGLLRGLGFRDVGVYEKHGQLDGVWRDVVIVERLIEGNL
jgi:phosphinothricin acetyltransferase